MKNSILPFAIVICTLPALFSCGQEDYDISRGIDREVTLFTNQVSLPIADVGPITIKDMMDGTELGLLVGEYLKIDDEGYLMADKSDQVFSDFIIMLAMEPDRLLADDFTGSLVTGSEALESLGIRFTPQILTFSGTNPLTEDISLSGKISLLSKTDEDHPTSEVFSTNEFSRVKVSAGATRSEILSLVNDGETDAGSFLIQNLVFHLPDDFMSLDPMGGFGNLALTYYYKSYVTLGTDLPEGIPSDIDVNLELAQYNVKQATIHTEVSNEIPVAIELTKAEVLVSEFNEEGLETKKVWEDVSISSGLKIAAGCPGKPGISPLEIVIKANEGTIPDIASLRLFFSIKAPVGVSDKRLGVNQRLYFNKLRATVSGGITIPAV